MRVTRSVVPNLFTLANLFCGVAAIVAAMEHNIPKAALLILLSGIFDMLDGLAARLTQSTSEFGVELDSLCDAVSFGVAPSILLYVQFFHSWDNWGLLLSSLPALCGVLRLARFNVQLTSTEDKMYFRGMPIPSGAFTIVSFLYFHSQNQLTFIPTDYLMYTVVGVTVITSLAMVSTIKYDNVPRPTLRSIKQRPFVFLVFLIAIVSAIFTGGKTVFPFMMLYMIGGAIRHGIQLLRNRNNDDDTIEEADPDPFTM